MTLFNGTTDTSANPPLALTQTSYDALNRAVCTAVRVTQGVFFGLTTPACQQSTGANNDHITQLTYDLAGQKLTEQRGVGSATPITYGAYGYSGDGNVATITDANLNRTTNTYDGYNRLVRVTFPSTAVDGLSGDTILNWLAIPATSATSLKARDAGGSREASLSR